MFFCYQFRQDSDWLAKVEADFTPWCPQNSYTMPSIPIIANARRELEICSLVNFDSGPAFSLLKESA